MKQGEEEEKSTVKLQAAFGESIIADLRNVEVSLVDSEDEEKQGEKVALTCALTDQLRSR